jgi:anti-sigma factor ChrR (cupin superfamily)
VLERVRAVTSAIRRAAEGTWQPVMPGIEVKTLFHDAAACTVSFLLRAQPNASLPAHRHTASEECVVLEGEFTLGDATLRAGDYLFAASGTDHPAATTRTGVLVYLRGSVADYPFASTART